MILTYRVTLEGIKGFFRVYKVDSASTLYKFHKQLQADLEFAQDQPILFKALDKAGGVVARWALVDLGYGMVDYVTFQDTIKAGVASMVYFYDTKAKKHVVVTLEGEAEPGALDSPVLTDSKGPNPIEFENGYVAFEDLPKDKRKLPGEDGDEDELEDEEDTDADDTGEGDEEEGENW